MRRSAVLLHLSGSGIVGERHMSKRKAAKQRFCEWALNSYNMATDNTKEELWLIPPGLFFCISQLLGKQQCCYAAFLPETEIRTSIRKIAAKPTPSRKVKLLPRTVAERMAAVTGSEKPYRLPFSGPMYFRP